MANRMCWQCEVKTHLTLKAESLVPVSSDRSSGTTVVAALFTCDECHFPSMGFAAVPRGEIPDSHLNDGPTQWFPVNGQ